MIAALANVLILMVLILVFIIICCLGTLSEYNQNDGKNRCNTDCKCGRNKKGCSLPTGVDDSRWCKGSLICRKNRCVDP